MNVFGRLDRQVFVLESSFRLTVGNWHANGMAPADALARGPLQGIRNESCREMLRIDMFTRLDRLLSKGTTRVLSE
jgi:hypothetical protein